MSTGCLSLWCQVPQEQSPSVRACQGDSRRSVFWTGAVPCCLLGECVMLRGCLYLQRDRIYACCAGAKGRGACAGGLGRASSCLDTLLFFFFPSLEPSLTQGSLECMYSIPCRKDVLSPTQPQIIHLGCSYALISAPEFLRLGGYKQNSVRDVYGRMTTGNRIKTWVYGRVSTLQ